MQEKRGGGDKQSQVDTQAPREQGPRNMRRSNTIRRGQDSGARDTRGNKTMRHQGQRDASYNKAPPPPPTLEFRPCALVGPDGQIRGGWEMIVGDMVFGKADAKETLLAYYSRLHDPLPSGHWKEQAWQPLKKKAGGRRPHQDPEESLEEADFEIEPARAASWQEDSA